MTEGRPGLPTKTSFMANGVDRSNNVCIILPIPSALNRSTSGPRIARPMGSSPVMMSMALAVTGALMVDLNAFVRVSALNPASLTFSAIKAGSARIRTMVSYGPKRLTSSPPMWIRMKLGLARQVPVEGSLMMGLRSVSLPWASLSAIVRNEAVPM